MNTQPRKTICLVMIVKNEEAFIIKALESVAVYIDYAVFLDSESTDETVERIKYVMGTYGVRHEIHNYTKEFRADEKRTEALRLAKDKAEYMLIMDADNTFEVTEFTGADLAGQKTMWPGDTLTGDAYLIKKMCGQLEYQVVSLLRNGPDWFFESIIHEYPTHTGKWHAQLLPGVIIHEAVKDGEGGRVRDNAAHYAAHANLLQQELIENKNLPDHLVSRYTFYLAQSWRDAGLFAAAIEWYQKRIALGGWAEEVWYSMYQIALIKNEHNHSGGEVMTAALQAWAYRPERLESAVFLMQILHSQGYNKGAFFIGLRSNPTTDILFVDTTAPARFNELYGELCKIMAGK